MSHICKMTGLEAELPCAAPQCPAYGDCAVAYAKSQQGFQLEQHHKTNLEHFREMTAEQLAEWIMCPYSADPDLCLDEDCVKCCTDFLNAPYDGFDLDPGEQEQ